jgi:signal transduction histidine kinase
MSKSPKGTTLTEHLPQLVQAAKWVTVGKALPSIIHDLNNALNTMIGFADLWRTDTTLSDNLRADLSEIVQAGLHARELLTLLREAVKAPVNDLPLGLGKVMLPQVCDQALGLLATPVRRCRIQVVRDYHPQTPSVPSSRGTLLLLLLCLLHNACEALADNGGTLTLRTYGAQNMAVLEVEDNGQGLPPRLQRRLFEPFTTTKPTGTGLGLFLADHLVRQMQGQLTLDSPKGEGTKAIVRLPAEDLSQRP